MLGYSETELAAKLGAGDARYLLRACNGCHDDPVADRKETKNFMARKSFSTLYDLARVDHWIQIFAAELLGRILSDTRTPRTLVMNWRGPGGTLAGRRKQVAMPNECRQPGVLLAAARSLAKSIGRELVPLNCLALIAEGLEAPDSSANQITSFFKPVGELDGGASASSAASPSSATAATAAADDYDGDKDVGQEADLDGWDDDDGDGETSLCAEMDLEPAGAGVSAAATAAPAAAVGVGAGAAAAAAASPAGMTASQQQTASDRRSANIAGGTFINPKAGMTGVDKALVQDTVFELSKGSKHYANEQRKAAAIDTKIEAIREKLRQPLPAVQAAAASKAIESYVAELEGTRDLSRTHLVVDMDAFYAAVSCGSPRDQRVLLRALILSPRWSRMICTHGVFACSLSCSYYSWSWLP